jgi:hypothetical protein
MSVFQVQLNNSKQGLLDVDPATGAQENPSIQRTIYVAGPNKINRELADGATFTDCNYWKRFAYPQVPLDQAIVTVLSDDGSIYSDVASENTFPAVYSTTCAAGSSYAANTIDIIGDTGSYAVFTQLKNTSSDDVTVKLNGLSTAVFTLDGNTTQIFNNGDLTLTSIAFANATGNPVTVETILSVKSVCNS